MTQNPHPTFTGESKTPPKKPKNQAFTRESIRTIFWFRISFLSGFTCESSIRPVYPTINIRNLKNNIDLLKITIAIYLNKYKIYGLDHHLSRVKVHPKGVLWLQKSLLFSIKRVVVGKP
jgi:hypothetical protein